MRILRSIKLKRKITALLTLFSLSLNIFQPAFFALSVAPIIAPNVIRAEEIDSPEPSPIVSEEPNPSVTPEPTPTPLPEPTIEPTSSPDPTPSPLPSPVATLTPSPSVTPTPSPESAATPTPSNTPTNPTPSSDSLPAPPAASTVASTSPSPSPIATSLNEELHIVVIENTEASSIEEFDLTVTETGSATLITDKADYAPTDTALITGKDFLPNTTYVLTIASNDPPATSTTVDVTTDEQGILFYAYQLDGTYRPNYTVVAYLGSTLIASTTFTDSYVVGSYLCDNDAQGANDQPGQKDLTKMCVDEHNLPTSIQANWNWDETGWSGNNTGDACALFDTDNDGLANFASCVTVEKDPAVQKSTSPRIFTCNDTRADRCSGPTLVAGPYVSSCTVTIASDQPFASGASTPQDVKASCSVQMSEVGGSGVADLIDVCSFPSDNPNSDPSDCIFAAPSSGKIEVVKVLSPSNDSGLFNLLIDNVVKAANVTNAGTTGENVVSAATHSVSETAGTGTSLSNYTTSISCRNLNGTGTVVASSNTTSVNVPVADASDIICTITNTRVNNATLTIIKDAAPNDAQDFSFTTTGTGLSSFSLDDDSDITLSNTKLFSNLAAGTYSVAESAVTGWAQTSSTCSDGSPVTAINLSQGESVTCTFVNTKQPTLTVNKTVINNNGGALADSNFPLLVNGNVVTSGATNMYSPGSYTISETQQTGYTQTSLTCDSGKTNPVQLTAGENVTCTITNDDIAPQLTVIKHVINDNNGTKTATNFTMQVSSNNVITNSFAGSESGTPVALSAGTYTVSETTENGYTASISGDCNENGAVTLAIGDTKTCTITNNDKPGTLIVKKVVSGGSKTTSDFSFTYNQVGPIFFEADGQNDLTVNAGLYTVSEITDADYAVSYDNCSNVQISNGGSATCTITNTRKTGKILIDKILFEGPASESDWDFTITGILGTFNDGSEITLNTGSYTITESQTIPGYTLTAVSGVCSELVSSDATLTVTEQGGTCSFTNTRDKGSVKVNKLVDLNGDNQYEGGNTEANALGFTWNLDGGSSNAMGATQSDIPTTLDGISHIVNENVATDYNFVGWYTTGSTQYSCANPEGATLPITVNVSKNTTTEITLCNQANIGRLIVQKTTIPTGGQTIFDITIAGTGTVEASATATVTDALDHTYVVEAGTYTVAESQKDGWTEVSNTCKDVIVGAGQTKTCEIENGQLPTLIVKKIVSGSNTPPSAFTFSVNETAAQAFEVDGQNDFVVNPGLYSVTEPTAEGYTTTYDNCTNLDLGYGDVETCTITNTRDTGSITIIKDAQPNNDQDFRFIGTLGEFYLDDDSNATLSNTKIFTNLPTGSYMVTEPNDFDKVWRLEVLNCTGGSDVGSEGRDLTVNLKKNENVVCTFVNVRETGSLTIIKDAINNNPQDFTFSTTGGTMPNSFKLDDDNNGTLPSSRTYSLPTGSYSVTESTASGWKLTNLQCTGLSDNDSKSLDNRKVILIIDPDENITCTFTNTELGKIIGAKFNDKNGNGNLNLLEGEIGIPNWQIFIDQNDNSQYDSGEPVTSTSSFFLTYGLYSFNNLVPGSYQVCETMQTGWYNSTPVCKNVSVTPGSTETANFGNHQDLTIRANKIVCDLESDLPNWGDNDAPNIGASTAQNYVNSHPGCRLEAGWEFQYGFNGEVSKYGNGDQLGVAPEPWMTLGTTNASGYVEKTLSDLEGHDGIWVREALKENYVPFSYPLAGPTENSYSAELYCHKDGNHYDNYDQISNIQFGATYYCVAFNALNTGDLEVTKYNDKNGNGEQDQNEEVLSNWDINVDDETVTTDQEGKALFTDLIVGGHKLSETMQAGWTQTNISCDKEEEQVSELQQIRIDENEEESYSVVINPGQTTYCQIGNQADPSLKIEKSNDATNAQAPGSDVMYTLKVTAIGSNVNNVIVIDTLSTGFTYRAGSWTANSSVRGDIAGLGEPTYGTSGIWPLGNMVDGEVVNLTYITDINSTQDSGIYKDIAWAEGDNSFDSSSVVALGENSEYVDGIFVGTDVEILKSEQQTGTVNIEKTGEVLGASTELPATGASALWIILATGLIIVGFTLIFGDKLMKKIMAVTLVLAVSLSLAGSAKAASNGDDNLQVRMETPKTPTRLNAWSLAFTALDRENRDITIKCFVKKPAGSFTQFGGDQLVHGAGNGACAINGSVMNDQGTYEFYVTASAGTGEDVTDITSVLYDTDGPGTPTGYNKEHPSECRWIIRFHTASDGGLTTKVEIYSSDTSNFDTHAGTRVGEVAIGSDANGEFIHDRGSDCGKTWYYVIRAFDAVGNQSGHIGDSVDHVRVVNPSPTTTAALVVTSSQGSVLGKTDQEGEVKGQEVIATPSTENGDGLIAGATEAAQKIVKSKVAWWIASAIIALAVLYGITKKSASRQK